MTSALPKDEKAKVRLLYAPSKVGRDAGLQSEVESNHGRPRAVEISAVGKQADFCR